MARVLVGLALWERPIRAAILTCAVSALAYAVSVAVEGGGTDDLGLFAEPLAASVVFSVLGAIFAARVLRPNKSLERTREG